MNILIDELPKAIKIDGMEYHINYGFRAIVLVEICIFSNKLTEEQRVLNALNIFYNGQIPTNISKAIESMLWFYRCGNEPKTEPKDKGKTKPRKKVNRAYDFEQDASYIYSAYLTQYKIDLNEISSNNLHWWKFKAMFDSLDEDLKFCKIMTYRTISVSGMSKEQKKFYNEMKNLYALRDDVVLDDKLKLAKRNQEMKDYVKNRFKGVSDDKS